jgi:aryl-alcohol dehydrogenase-like predicted oxidoreductase
MNSTDFSGRKVLGRTRLEVGRMGLAAGYNISAKAVEKAFHEFGVNYFYWVTRKPGMREALGRILATHREEAVVAIQSYDHLGFWLRRSVEGALRELRIDQVDVLLLGWFNRMPGRRLSDVASRLREEGKVRFLGVTGHNRDFHGELAHSPTSPFDVLQIRYSAAHRGAEEDVFQDLPEERPGLTTYTATRWGRLLNPGKMPPGERPLSAAECYRFVLSHPAVDLCLAGPKNEKEMVEGLAALRQGPLTPEEMDRIRRIGDYVHG